MAKDLEERIEERKQQARDRNINEKAWTVAKYLGKKGVYEDQYFGISQYGADTYRSARRNTGTKILYGENCRLVFDETKEDVLAYAPGSWEAKLSELYSRALAKKEIRSGTNAKRCRTIRIKKENEMKQRWGLR